MIIFTGVGSMSVRVGLQSEYYHIPDHVFPLATPDQRTMFQLINQSSIPKTKEGVVGFDYTAEELIEEASAVFFERAQAPQEPCIITFSKVETDTTGNSTYTPV